MRLAKQETLTPAGHLVSSMQGSVNVHRGCSIVGATVTVQQLFCITFKNVREVLDDSGVKRKRRRSDSVL